MTENQSADTTRRKLVVGAAWAAPAIALAVAAPAAAASTVDTRFESTITISASGTAGSRGNITVSSGVLALHGNEGDSTGVLYITATAPSGYTTSLTDGGQLGEWTVSVVGEDPTVVELVHPGGILASASSLSIPFPGFVFTGTGATATNYASLNIYSTVFGDIVSSRSPGSRG